MNIFGVDRNSVVSWIDRFMVGGPDGLEDDGYPGDPRMLSEAQKEVPKQLLRRYPSRPGKILKELEQQTGITIRKWKLRNYAKRFRLSWKRYRRGLKQKRDEDAFLLAQGGLAKFIDEPDVNVVYFDEARFSLKAVVFYGWQTVGEPYEIPVTKAHGKNIKSFGFQKQDGTTMTYLSKGSVTSEVVISIFDDFSQTNNESTVVGLDNASVHTNATFQAKLENGPSEVSTFIVFRRVA